MSDALDGDVDPNTGMVLQSGFPVDIALVTTPQ